MWSIRMMRGEFVDVDGTVVSVLHASECESERLRFRGPVEVQRAVSLYVC